MIETFIYLIVVLAIIFIAAWGAKYIIETFFPEPVRTPAMVVVGVVLLIALVIVIAKIAGGDLRLPKFGMLLG